MAPAATDLAHRLTAPFPLPPPPYKGPPSSLSIRTTSPSSPRLRSAAAPKGSRSSAAPPRSAPPAPLPPVRAPR
jgi:hypothetical protein